MSYTDCLFFAEKTSGHKHAGLAGTVLVIARKLTEDMRNGSTLAAVGVPRGDTRAIPVRTWVAVEYLARKCVEVTEEDARAIHPKLFQALESYDRAPEYRTGHALTVAEGVRRGTYTLQPACPHVLAILRPSRPVETPEGFEHR